jgi:Fe-S-cluster containining protein
LWEHILQSLLPARFSLFGGRTKMDAQLPQYARKLHDGEAFSFRCHEDLPCFTSCCRDLELALTPYDVLRLKNALQMKSGDFLHRYVIIEKEEHETFPRFYLTMVDDGRASCPFITGTGCRAYNNRPGACRTYPLGRAVSVNPDGCKEEFHVLLTESHCRGFDASTQFTIDTWNTDQDLIHYNMVNDEVMSLLQHEGVKQGGRLSKEQVDMFTFSLYNLDEFRSVVRQKNFVSALPEAMQTMLPDIEDDTILLRFAVNWLKNEFFGDTNRCESLFS